MLAHVLGHLRQQYLGLLALFVALGGTSYAVATGSVDSREIKNNSIGTTDIRNNSLRGGDVRNRSLTERDLKLGTLPAGARGPAGPAGPAGSARGYARFDAGGFNAAQSKGVVSAVPAAGGDWCFDLSFTPNVVLATRETGSVGSVSDATTSNAGTFCPANARDAFVNLSGPGTFFVMFN